MNFRILPFLLLSSSCFALAEQSHRSFANDHDIQVPSCNILDTFYPKVKNGDRLWISADVLYWIPIEDCIVLTNHKTDLFTVNDITLQPPLHSMFNWDLGSRIGFGYLFDTSEAWDMAFYWAYYPSNTKKKSSTRNNVSEGMFPIWSLADDIIQYDWVAFAKLHWTVDLNLLDFDFGRAYSFRWFHIRPYTGLRSAWVAQDFVVKYGGGIFANGPDLYAMSNNAGYDLIHMENNYWGIGPKLGVEPLFDLGKGWRVYANVCGSFTCGYFHLVQNEDYLMRSRFHKDHNHIAVRWIVDTSGGLSWEKFIASGRYALSFNLGWEYHLFINQFALQRDRFGLVPHNRDLAVTGGFFSGRFDF